MIGHAGALGSVDQGKLRWRHDNPLEKSRRHAAIIPRTHPDLQSECAVWRAAVQKRIGADGGALWLRLRHILHEAPHIWAADLEAARTEATFVIAFTGKCGGDRPCLIARTGIVSGIAVRIARRQWHEAAQERADVIPIDQHSSSFATKPQVAAQWRDRAGFAPSG